jgi:HEAT repeat protein
MELCAHHAARPGARGEAQAMAKTLVMIASHPHAASVRVHVINLAGYVGDGRVVPQIAPLLMDESREVRDAARIALERIPGSASDNALKAAAKSVRDEDKPAILQSLANRAKTPKTVGIKG